MLLLYGTGARIPFWVFGEHHRKQIGNPAAMDKSIWIVSTEECAASRRNATPRHFHNYRRVRDEIAGNSAGQSGNGITIGLMNLTLIARTSDVTAAFLADALQRFPGKLLLLLPLPR